MEEPNIDVATRLAAAVAYGSEQRQRATVKVGGVRRATVDHRSPEPRQRLGEQARVVGFLRGGNRFTRGVFCFSPFTEPNLVLRDHVQELRLFRVVSKRARRDQQLATRGNGRLCRLALQCACAMPHATQAECHVIVGTAIEPGERSVAELFAERVASFGLRHFSESMQRPRAITGSARGAFRHLEELARLSMRVDGERAVAGSHRVTEGLLRNTRLIVVTSRFPPRCPVSAAPSLDRSARGFAPSAEDLSSVAPRRPAIHA